MLKMSPKTKNLEFEVITITPDTARAFLDKNWKNRKLLRSHVAKLASDMKEGNWKITGDGIRFSREGVLLDGQHRLAACISADTPFETLVIYNLDHDMQEVIDTGKSRSATDVFQMAGHVNASNLSAVCRLLYVEAHSGSVYKTGITNSQILNVLEFHPSLPFYMLTSGATPRGVAIRDVSFINYAGAVLQGNRGDAAKYIEVMKTGVPSYDGCPVHLWRERLIRETANKASKMDREAKYNTYKHVWNMLVSKTSLSVLRIATSHVAIKGVPKAAYSKA